MINRIEAVVILTSVALVSIASYYKGYSTAEAEGIITLQEYKAKQKETQDNLLKRLRETQQQLYKTEKAWLEDEAKKDVIYKTKEKKVIKTVTKYIKVNDLSKCRIGNAGMQQINKALTFDSRKESTSKTK